MNDIPINATAEQVEKSATRTADGGLEILDTPNKIQIKDLGVTDEKIYRINAEKSYIAPFPLAEKLKISDFERIFGVEAEYRTCTSDEGEYKFALLNINRIAFNNYFFSGVQNKDIYIGYKFFGLDDGNIQSFSFDDKNTVTGYANEDTPLNDVGSVGGLTIDEWKDVINEISGTLDGDVCPEIWKDKFLFAQINPTIDESNLNFQSIIICTKSEHIDSVEFSFDLGNTSLNILNVTDSLKRTKQDKLIAGENITIQNNTISASEIDDDTKINHSKSDKSIYTLNDFLEIDGLADEHSENNQTTTISGKTVYAQYIQMDENKFKEVFYPNQDETDTVGYGWRYKIGGIDDKHIEYISVGKCEKDIKASYDGTEYNYNYINNDNAIATLDYLMNGSNLPDEFVNNIFTINLETEPQIDRSEPKYTIIFILTANQLDLSKLLFEFEENVITVHQAINNNKLEIAKKQDKLTAGENIEIKDNVISATGGTIIIDDELSETSVNPVQNKVITSELNDKQDMLVAGANIEIFENIISAKNETENKIIADLTTTEELNQISYTVCNDGTPISELKSVHIWLSSTHSASGVASDVRISVTSNGTDFSSADLICSSFLNASTNRHISAELNSNSAYPTLTASYGADRRAMNKGIVRSIANSSTAVINISSPGGFSSGTVVKIWGEK